MVNFLNKLTVIIVTFNTKFEILQRCLDSIDQDVNIFIIENSKAFNFDMNFLNKYKNIKIFFTGKNLGYGAGNNIGINKCETKYALITNPDIKFDKNFFYEINKYLNNNIDFSLIGIQYYEHENLKWDSAGFFRKKIKISNIDKYDKNNLFQVDWIVGCCMLLKPEEYISKKVFDENFFLFFEEFDLCQSLKKTNKKIFTSKNLIVDHLGFKSSEVINKNDELNLERLRNWHYMWSFFYYHKKNYGLSYAYRVSIGKLLRSLIKFLYYFFTFNKKKKIIYFYRFYGLVHSILGKQSSFRID